MLARMLRNGFVTCTFLYVITAGRLEKLEHALLSELCLARAIQKEGSGVTKTFIELVVLRSLLLASHRRKNVLSRPQSRVGQSRHS